MRRIPLALAALLLAALTVACAAQPDGETPPAVDVPAPPAATVAAQPPTMATLPAIGGSEPDGGELAAAIQRTRSAAAYRVTDEIVTSASTADSTRVDLFLRYAAAARNGDSRIVFERGAFNDLIGGGERIEIVNVEKRTYMRGSTLYNTVEADRWYVLPDSAMTRMPFDGWDLLTAAGIDGAAMRFAGNVALDGMTCAAYNATFIPQGVRLIELTAAPNAASDFSRIDRANARIAACADGYVHALDFDVAAHVPAQPAERATTRVTIRLFDFNADTIRIAAPSGAIEVK